MNAIKKLFILSLTFTAAAVYAQVSPSVTGTGFSLWAGGEYSNFAPDYGSNRLNGLGFIIDVNATPRIGAVGEARWLHWSGSGGETQSDYLSGVKYRMFKSGPLSFNAKFLLGGVWITFPGDIGSGSYFALAPGGFVDFHLTHRLLIRGDYEYQFLPSAPDIPPFPSHGLTPNGVSIGVEYNIFGRY
jgi:hypothetical protein